MMLLNLQTLESGDYGITPEYGAGFAQAASVCLDERGHSSPTAMKVHDGTVSTATIVWTTPTGQMRRTWNDDEYATEHGAYGIAALVVRNTKSLQILTKAKKGKGFDFWLGPLDEKRTLRANVQLEVSGIRAGTPARIKRRLKEKVQQLTGAGGKIPALVVVVEFGGPQTQIVQAR